MVSGDEQREWFKEQVGQNMNGLFGTAFRLARKHDDAEELVAETVAKAWAALDTLADSGNFRAWIYRILANCFMSECRRRKREKLECDFNVETGLDGEDEEPFSLFERLHQPFLLWWGNPEQEYINGILREDIEQAMAALPAAYRLVVALVDVEGLSYQEAGQMLDVPVGTVRSRLARGRNLLQKALWRHAEEAGLRSPGEKQVPA